LCQAHGFRKRDFGRDCVEDIVELVESLDEPPIVLGHSLGGLIAQLVSVKTKVEGLILMGTAPAAGIFAFYPSNIVCFYKHFLRWGFWKKSMPPYKHVFYDYCMNNQDEADKEREFSKIFDEKKIIEKGHKIWTCDNILSKRLKEMGYDICISTQELKTNIYKKVSPLPKDSQNKK